MVVPTMCAESRCLSNPILMIVWPLPGNYCFQLQLFGFECCRCDRIRATGDLSAQFPDSPKVSKIIGKNDKWDRRGSDGFLWSCQTAKCVGTEEGAAIIVSHTHWKWFIILYSTTFDSLPSRRLVHHQWSMLVHRCWRTSTTIGLFVSRWSSSLAACVSANYEKDVPAGQGKSRENGRPPRCGITMVGWVHVS